MMHMCTIPIFWLEHVYCTKHIDPASGQVIIRNSRSFGNFSLQPIPGNHRNQCQNHLPIEMGLKFCTHTWKHQLDPHCFYAPYIIDPIVRLLKHLKTQSMFWNFNGNSRILKWRYCMVLYHIRLYVVGIFPYIGHWFMFSLWLGLPQVRLVCSLHRFSGIRFLGPTHDGGYDKKTPGTLVNTQQKHICVYGCSSPHWMVQLVFHLSADSADPSPWFFGGLETSSSGGWIDDHPPVGKKITQRLWPWHKKNTNKINWYIN